MGNQKGGVMTFFKNIQEGFSSTEEKDLAAAQGTVPTILMIAGFAVVAILAVTWIGNSIAWQAHLQARCISQQEGFETTNGSPGKKCIGADTTYSGPVTIEKQINNTKGGRF
jgi:hypothetical protein